MSKTEIVSYARKRTDLRVSEKADLKVGPTGIRPT
jgi:hypothetical protein